MEIKELESLEDLVSSLNPINWKLCIELINSRDIKYKYILLYIMVKYYTDNIIHISGNIETWSDLYSIITSSKLIESDNITDLYNKLLYNSYIIEYNERRKRN